MYWWKPRHWWCNLNTQLPILYWTCFVFVSPPILLIFRLMTSAALSLATFNSIFMSSTFSSSMNGLQKFRIHFTWHGYETYMNLEEQGQCSILHIEKTPRTNVIIPHTGLAKVTSKFLPIKERYENLHTTIRICQIFERGNWTLHINLNSIPVWCHTAIGQYIWEVQSFPHCSNPTPCPMETGSVHTPVHNGLMKLLRSHYKHTF